MLRRFVREDEEGRKELYKIARKYYDQLYLNYPTASLNFVCFLLLLLLFQMDEFEYKANMEFGKVYLEVMSRPVKEGFEFISPELELWQDYSFLSIPDGDFSDSKFGRKAAD
jgi:hypothetical protein